MIRPSLSSIVVRVTLLLSVFAVASPPALASAPPERASLQQVVKHKSKVWFSDAVAGHGGGDVCGDWYCQKLTVKVTCKPRGQACLKGRTVRIWNKNPYGDNIWRVMWTGKTNRWGTVSSRWISSGEWYYTYCCSSYGNPLRVTVAKKKATIRGKQKVFTGASWAGEVSYRSVDLSP